MLKVEPTDMSYLAHSQFPNCVDLALGVANQNRNIGVVFEGEISEEQTTHLKFSLVFDFIYNGVRNTLINERYIEVRKGSKELAEQEMLKGLESDINRLRLNQNAGI